MFSKAFREDISIFLPFVVSLAIYYVVTTLLAMIPADLWLRKAAALIVFALPFGLTLVIAGFFFAKLFDDKGEFKISLTGRILTYIFSSIAVGCFWLLTIPIGISYFPDLIEMGIMASFDNIGIVWGVAMLAVHLGFLFILERFNRFGG